MRIRLPSYWGLLGLFALASPGFAQVPTPEDVVGFPMGGSVTDYGGLYRYLDAIEESPRLRISTFGETFEHRELILLTISSPDNLARLEEIQRDTRRLADPRGLAPDAAEAIIARTPAGVFLNYGNDGNESAAFEAALWMAWELLSGRHDELLEDLVVYVVPASNPDSHERFAAWFKATARWPDGDPDPNAVEHRAPWGLSTNNNHYQINLNRDSVWSTQPENRALVRLYLDTRPMVFVDHHGETDAFIGPWMAEPLHTVLTGNQRDWLVEYGRAMAADFAAEGFPYSPWEFGQFDPGYWDTLPNFTGSIGFTLETTGGGWRGLRIARPGGGEYTLRDGIEQHLIAGRSVLAVTAAHRERRLRDYLAYRRGGAGRRCASRRLAALGRVRPGAAGCRARRAPPGRHRGPEDVVRGHGAGRPAHVPARRSRYGNHASAGKPGGPRRPAGRPAAPGAARAGRALQRGVPRLRGRTPRAALRSVLRASGHLDERRRLLRHHRLVPPAHLPAGRLDGRRGRPPATRRLGGSFPGGRGRRPAAHGGRVPQPGRGVRVPHRGGHRSRDPRRRLAA